MYLALSPLAMVWVFADSKDMILGLENANRRKASQLWKLGIVAMIALEILIIEFNIWTIVELLILIPMVGETAILSSSRKSDLPILTLRLSEELQERFSVSLSIIKTISFIMVAYMFELLNLRFWLLVVLIYFLIGFFWSVAYLVPDEWKTNEKRKSVTKTSTTSGKKERPREKEMISKNTSQLNQSIATVENNMNLSSEEITTLSSNAFQAGQRIRKKIQKPYYTLNHILATLSEEDFSAGYKVPVDGLKFRSIDGEWEPKAGLVLFPIKLEKYDFRRSNQTLLLAFHTPIKGKTSFAMDFGNDFTTKIGKNSVRFGAIEFNPRTIIVNSDEFETRIKPKLVQIDDSTDISYTGFKNLQHMKEILTKMADKWIEVRYKAKEVTVNFIAGLFGATDPIFIPKPNPANSSGELVQSDQTMLLDENFAEDE